MSTSRLFRFTSLLALAAGLAGCEDASTERAADATRTDDAIRLPDLDPTDAARPDATPIADAEPPDVRWWTDDLGRVDAAPTDAAESDAASEDAGDGASPQPDLGPSVDRRCIDERVAPPLPDVDLGARCRAQGQAMRIHDFRHPGCPDHAAVPRGRDAEPVELVEVVVVRVTGNAFTVQDPGGGAYSGLDVFNRAGFDARGQLRPGTRVSLRGPVQDFFGLDQLSLLRRDDITVLGEGPPTPPVRIAEPADIATGGRFADALESVIVEVDDVFVLNTEPDCPRDLGNFLVTGPLRVVRSEALEYLPARGDALPRITGLLTFSFGEHRLIPMTPEDIESVECGGIPDKCEASECAVEPDSAETGALVITELQIDPEGDDTHREYVEIYNPGGQAVALDGYRLQDCAGRAVTLSGEVGPRSAYVLVRNADRDLNGGVRGDHAGFDQFFLPNGDGTVLLFDANDNLVDQVRYEAGGDWPPRRVGHSIELLEPASDNRRGENWTLAVTRYGEGGHGTPGTIRRE